MNSQKAEIKAYVNSVIQEKIDGSHYESTKKFWVRVGYICKANVNRLSYSLMHDKAGKIYLHREDRDRVIELKAHDLNLSETVFEAAQKLLADVGVKYPKPAKVSEGVAV